MVQTGGPEFLFDARIVGEYSRVLRRPEFLFRPDAVMNLLSALQSSGLEIDAAPLPVRLPDPDDLPFLEVAAAGRAQALVTGNARHFVPVQDTHQVRVLSPREALEMLVE